MFSAEMILRFSNMLDACIGDPKKITPAVFDEATHRWEGGIRVERINRMTSVDKKGRNYGLASMLQHAPNIAAPSAGNKVSNTSEEGRELRREVVEVSPLFFTLESCGRIIPTTRW